MGREIRQRTLTVITGAAGATSAITMAAGGGLVTIHLKTGLSLLIGGFITAVVPSLLLGFSDIRHAGIEERRRAIRCFVEMTHQLLKMEESHQLRVTLLEVDKSKDPHVLRQAARHTWEGTAPAGKTDMTIQQGVAGRCYNKRKNVIVNLDDGDYIEQMLEYGFSEEQAKKFVPRRAYLCCPVVNGNTEVIAVLSLDAINEKVFTPEHTELAEGVTPFFARLLTEPDREERNV